MGGEGGAGADDPLVKTELESEEGGQLDHLQGGDSCSPADEMKFLFASSFLASIANKV